MSIFLNLYSRWTTYEWMMILGSLLVSFLIINLFSFIFSKNIKICIPISITLVFSGLLSILLMFLYRDVLKIPVSNLSLLSTNFIIIFIAVNWLQFLLPYIKRRKSKKFSIVKLNREYLIDTMGQIILITLPLLFVSFFLRGEQIAVSLTTVLVSCAAIYLCTFLTKKFVHD